MGTFNSDFTTESKLVLLTIFLSLSEFLALYGAFVKKLPQTSKYKFKLEDLREILHRYSSEDLLAKESTKKLLQLCGINMSDSEPVIIQKHKGQQKLGLETASYLKRFEELTNTPTGYLPFSKLNGLFLVLFLNEKLKEINQKVKAMHKLCSRKAENSLYNSFVKFGMDSKHPRQPNITFRMVEKVINDQRNHDPDNLRYKQVRNIMKLVQERMQIDKVTNTEKTKEAFEAVPGECKVPFGKWLAYVISL